MSNIDYEELIRSPLDDADAAPGSPWWFTAGGLVAGVAAGLVLMLVIGGEEAAPTTVVQPEQTVAEVGGPVEAVAADYPDGYTEISPGLAARPEEIIVDDNRVTVAFTSVVERGADPATMPWPRGGSWLLDTSAGVTLASDRVVFGGFTPGAFSVHFPAANLGPPEFERVRLVERWDTEAFNGSTSLPFAAVPFETSETITLPVSQDVTLLLRTLELGRYSGTAEWQISGAEMGATVAITAVLLDGDDEEVGAYAAFPQVRDPGNEGLLDLNWQRSFPDDQEGAVTVDVAYEVDVVEVTATDVEFSLAGVPDGRS